MTTPNDADLQFLRLGYVGVGDGLIQQPAHGFLFSTPLTNMVYHLPFFSYLAGSKSKLTLDALWCLRRRRFLPNFVDPPPHSGLGVRRDVGGQGWAHLIARPRVPISSLLTVFELLKWLQSVSARPSTPDTMTNTAKEATASTSGKN